MGKAPKARGNLKIMTTTTDWAILPKNFRMGQSVALEGSHGPIEAVCQKFDPEVGNPAWVYIYRNAAGEKLAEAACFGVDPRSDLIVGFRVADCTNNPHDKRVKLAKSQICDLGYKVTWYPANLTSVAGTDDTGETIYVKVNLKDYSVVFHNLVTDEKTSRLLERPKPNKKQKPLK